MGSRDHSFPCSVCGFDRGGLNDLHCDCYPGFVEWPAISAAMDIMESAERLDRLASNLAIAASLERAFCLGRIYGYASCPCDDIFEDEDWERIDARHWHPGCARPALKDEQ